MPQRRHLLLLLLILNLPLGLLALTYLRSGYGEIHARINEQQMSLARSGALAAESFLVHNIATLRTLSADLRDADTVSVDVLETRLAGYVASNPRWDGMSVVGSDFRVISGSQRASRGFNLADRPYLQALFATGEPQVSDGLVPAVTRVPSVIVAVPIQFGGGGKGAILASVSVDDLAGHLRELIPESEGRRLSLIDRSGKRLVQPGGLEPLSQVEPSPFMQEAVAGRAGVTTVDRSDGRRLVAYAPVLEFGWVVTVSDSSAVALAPARRFLWQGAAVLAVGSITVAVAGYILGRHLHRSYDLVASARERAEEAIRSRDEFLAVASHELRNPLAAVMGRAQQMQRFHSKGLLTEESLGAHLDELLASSRHLARLVDDLLNVSRLQAGRFDLKLERVRLDSVVGEAIDETLGEGDRVEVDLPRDAALFVDAGRIRQVMSNLLSNAAKYSPEGSPIRVGATTHDGRVSITVTDQGIGLPRADVDRVFEPFARASNAVRANIPGLGLGLYLSRQLVEAHGGSLTASSPGEGRGSTFTMTLPEWSPGEDVEGQSAARPVATAG